MIYCVEDERNIRELIVYTLESSGFTARGLESGKELNAAIAEQLPDLILLDIMLPGEDGLEILSRLKASEVTKEIPVIMVTAKGAEYDKVMGLDCGADDYITKPFGMMEFIARVRAVLRRAGKEEKENDVLETGDLQIQVKQHQVLAKGEKVTLTLKEFELLKFLMENKGIVLTRDRLLGRYVAKKSAQASSSRVPFVLMVRIMPRFRSLRYSVLKSGKSSGSPPVRRRKTVPAFCICSARRTHSSTVRSRPCRSISERDSRT